MRGILDREKHILKHSPSDAGQYVWSRVLMGAGTIFFGACSFACCGDGCGTNRSRLFLIVSCFIESLYREARALHVLCPYHSVLEF